MGLKCITMADGSSVDVILDFLRRNKFTRAEEALRSEITNRSDLNGFLQNLTLERRTQASFHKDKMARNQLL